MITLTIYTADNCSLCHSLKADLLAIQPKIGFVLLEQNLDRLAVALSEDECADGRAEQDELGKLARYRNLLPVLDIEFGEVLYSPFSYDELFDAIDDAIERAAQSADT